MIHGEIISSIFVGVMYVILIVYIPKRQVIILCVDNRLLARKESMEPSRPKAG